MIHETHADREDGDPGLPGEVADRNDLLEMLSLTGLNDGLIEALLDYAEGRGDTK